MGDDIDFDLENTKSARKTGRRRKPVLDDDNLDAVLDSALETSKPQPQPRKPSKARDRDESSQNDFFDDNQSRAAASKNQSKQAVSGWGEDDMIDFNPAQSINKPHRRDIGSTGASNDFSKTDSDSRGRKVNERKFNAEEMEIPEIPDLEETVDASEDMAFKVAEAPDVQVHQISTYKELDKEFFREKAFQFLEGNIDVSLLHCGLNTEQQIAEEEDVIWEWNKLFTEVVSVLSVTKESEIAQDAEAGAFDEDITKTKSDTVSTGQRFKEKEIVF